MTATPRIFGNKPKQKADEGKVVLSSMDDEAIFGIEFLIKVLIGLLKIIY